MLVFMMMFGSSLTVMAAKIDTYLTVGMEIPAGETIEIPQEMVTSGGITIYVDGDQAAKNENYQTTRKLYVVQGYTYDNNSMSGSLKLSTTPTGASAGGTAPDPTSYICQHEYEWVIGIMPTEEKDGRFDYKCKHCGSVTAHQPMTFFYVIIWNILEDIKEAPANGVVTVDNKYLRSLSDEIIDALQARPDVTLDVKFTDQGVPLHFTIPAGMAPTDEAEWYGYYYLGSQYGWIWE